MHRNSNYACHKHTSRINVSSALQKINIAHRQRSRSAGLSNLLFLLWYYTCVRVPQKLRTWLFKLFGPNAPPFWQLKMLWMSTFEASLLREMPLMKSVSKHDTLSSLSQNNVPLLPSILSVKSASVPTAKKWPFGPAPWNSSSWACTNEGCDPWGTKQGWHTISKNGDFPAPDAAVTTRWHRGRVRHSGFLG